ADGDRCTFDQCNGSGSCVFTSVASCAGLDLKKVGLWTNSQPARSNGFVRLRASVDDSDTFGDLRSSLLANTVIVEVTDSGLGPFHVSIALTGCQQALDAIRCRSADNRTRARFRLFRGSASMYHMRVSQVGLGTAETGYRSPRGPVQVRLRQ